jgi:hypothetical protein
VSVRVSHCITFLFRCPHSFFLQFFNRPIMLLARYWKRCLIHARRINISQDYTPWLHLSDIRNTRHTFRVTVRAQTWKKTIVVPIGDTTFPGPFIRLFLAKLKRWAWPIISPFTQQDTLPAGMILHSDITCWINQCSILDGSWRPWTILFFSTLAGSALATRALLS